MVSFSSANSDSAVSTPAGFAPPDFTGDLDVVAWLASVPAGATCKGLVAESLLEELVAARLPPVTKTKFIAFRDFPMRDILELKVATARALCPDVPLRQGLAVVGRGLFPKFTSTLLGRVMYGVFGGNVSAILRLANKSYAQTQSTGRVDPIVLGPRAINLRFTNAYTFIDSYHVGVVEGTLAACKVQGEVLVKMTSPCDGDLLVRWAPKA